MSIGQTNIGMIGSSGLFTGSGMGLCPYAGVGINGNVAAGGFSVFHRAGASASNFIYSPSNNFRAHALLAAPESVGGNSGSAPSAPGGAGGGDDGVGSSNDLSSMIRELLADDIAAYGHLTRRDEINKILGTVVDQTVLAGLTVEHIYQVIGAILKNPVARRMVLEDFEGDDTWKQFFQNPEDEHLIFRWDINEAIRVKVPDNKKAIRLLNLFHQQLYRYNGVEAIEGLPEIVKQLRGLGMSSDEMAGMILEVVETSGGYSFLAFKSVPVALSMGLSRDQMFARFAVALEISMYIYRTQNLRTHGIFRALPHFIKAGLEPEEIDRLCWDSYKHVIGCLGNFQQMERAFPAAAERVASVFSRDQIVGVFDSINEQYEALSRIVYFYLAACLSEPAPGESTALARPLEVISLFLDGENRATQLGKAVALAGKGWLFGRGNTDYREMMHNLRVNLTRESVVQDLLNWYQSVEKGAGSQDIDRISRFVGMQLALGTVINFFTRNKQNDEQPPHLLPFQR